MLFFLAHFLISPAFNNKRLRAKASVKLLISVALFLSSAWTFPVASPESFLRFFLLYLIAESALDIGLFAALLYGDCFLHRAEHKAS